MGAGGDNTALWQAALLHLACFGIAVVAGVTRHAPTEWAAGVALYALAAGVVVGIGSTRPRLPRWATAAVALESLMVAAVCGATGIVPVRSFGLLFVLTFAWFGMHHPPLTGLLLVPSAVIAYILGVELSIADAPPLDARGVGLMVGVCALVGESVAIHVSRAARSAAAFRTVSTTSSQLTLDGDPLGRVALAVIDLGYDAANLAVLDATANTLTVTHALGAVEQFAGTYAAGDGLAGQVRDTGKPFVVDDYQRWPGAIEAIRASGVRTSVGVPVLADGLLAGVLVGSYVSRRAVRDEDVAALELLARAAGTALDAAGELETERAANRALHTIANSDPLTGLGSRRAAQPLLDGLQPGDCVAILDLDHFKQVNDQHGHQAGDNLLVELAHHLGDELRDSDRVVRYGGEEFLIVLPATSVERAGLILERVRSSWHTRVPVTSFSVGVALHCGNDAQATVKAADTALYAAKAAGRDSVVIGPAHMLPAAPASITL